MLTGEVSSESREQIECMSSASELGPRPVPDFGQEFWEAEIGSVLSDGVKGQLHSRTTLLDKCFTGNKAHT